MAEPFDSAAFLEDVSAVAQTQYFTEFTEETPGRFGRITTQLFKPYPEEVVGTGKVMQIELAPADTVRSSLDALGAMASPDAFEAGSITVRFNRQDSSVSDFSRLSAAAQVDDIDVREAGKGSIVNFVDRIYNQVMPNFDEHVANLQHLGRSARVALVNGTPAQNDNVTFASCTATPTNATGMRVPVDAGSVASFRRGTRVDFYSSAGVLHAGNVRVTDTSPGDATGPTIGVEFVSTGLTARQSTGNIATIADNDEIFFSGEKNQGIYGLGAYFSRPAATGDSFIGGVNRMTAANRWLIPTATREGVAAASIQASHFDDIAIAGGFRVEPGQNGMVVMTDPTIHQKLRNDIFQSVIIQQPLDDSTAKRFANFGSVGLNYQHGHFGTVKIMSDPLCPPNTVRIIDPETWKFLYYAFKGLQPVRENGGHWYRLQESAPNTGKSLIWKADWYSLMCGWCTKPWRNLSILNVTA